MIFDMLINEIWLSIPLFILFFDTFHIWSPWLFSLKRGFYRFLLKIACQRAPRRKSSLQMEVLMTEFFTPLKENPYYNTSPLPKTTIDTYGG
jgi:hypothetical protein